jgi:acyl-CoA hydrolase
MSARPVSDSQVTITELMVPSFANFSGKVHGGILLSLMDKVAYTAATKFSRAYCVTVSVDGVQFRKPVEVGDLVSLAASVNYVGNSSMIIGIRVESLKPKTGEVKHTNSCYFTMVAKNEDGTLAQVPELILKSEEDIRRFHEAKMLKSKRGEIRELMNRESKGLTQESLRDAIGDSRCIIDFD